jgi:hypothetical protein
MHAHAGDAEVIFHASRALINLIASSADAENLDEEQHKSQSSRAAGAAGGISACVTALAAHGAREDIALHTTWALRYMMPAFCTCTRDDASCPKVIAAEEGAIEALWHVLHIHAGVPSVLEQALPTFCCIATVSDDAAVIWMLVQLLKQHADDAGAANWPCLALKLIAERSSSGAARALKAHAMCVTGVLRRYCSESTLPLVINAQEFMTALQAAHRAASIAADAAMAALLAEEEAEREAKQKKAARTTQSSKKKKKKRGGGGGLEAHRDAQTAASAASEQQAAEEEQQLAEEERSDDADMTTENHTAAAAAAGGSAAGAMPSATSSTQLLASHAAEVPASVNYTAVSARADADDDAAVVAFESAAAVSVAAPDAAVASLLALQLANLALNATPPAAPAENDGVAAAAAAAVAATPPPPPPPVMKECCVCLDETLLDDMLLLVPCGHRCACGACAAALLARPLARRMCPICSTAVSGMMRVFDI